MNTKKKLVFGVGVNDWKGSTIVNGKIIKEYTLWYNMLRRCFCKNFKNRVKTYSNVSCCESWLNLNNFIADISTIKNYDKCINDDWQLDKDILIKGNKIYSKDNCCFVPREINSLLISCTTKRGDYPIGVNFDPSSGMYKSQIRLNGKKKSLGYFKSCNDAFIAYKTYKEDYIRQIANKYKNLLAENVYNSLISWEVKIDD